MQEPNRGFRLRGDLMKRLVLIFCAALAIAFAGCSGNNAAELYETAQLEELQQNHEHAMSIYQEIIERYPEGKHAENARARLSALKKEK